VDPVPDPLLVFQAVPGIETGSRICSQELWPLDHRSGPFPCTPLKNGNGKVVPVFN
jgi:hypothetical protein